MYEFKFDQMQSEKCAYYKLVNVVCTNVASMKLQCMDVHMMSLGYFIIRKLGTWTTIP